jgi:hypothetical protein
VAPAAEARTGSSIVLKTIKVGGLRPGDAVVVTGRGAERMSPAAVGATQCADGVSAGGG